MAAPIRESDRRRLDILADQYRVLADVSRATQRQMRDATIALLTLSVAMMPTLFQSRSPDWLYAVIPLILFIVYLRVVQVYGDVHVQAAYAKYLEAQIVELVGGDELLVGYQADVVQPVYLQWRLCGRRNGFLVLVTTYNAVIMALSLGATWLCATRADSLRSYLHASVAGLFALYMVMFGILVIVGVWAMKSLDDFLSQEAVWRPSAAKQPAGDGEPA